MKRPKKVVAELYVRYFDDDEAWPARRGASTDVEGFVKAAVRLIEDGAAEVGIRFGGFGPLYTIEEYVDFMTDKGSLPLPSPSPPSCACPML